jgi:DNA-binding NtrC family response regulator
MHSDDSSILSVLAVLTQQADRAALTGIFSHSNWHLHSCGTLAEARSGLRAGKAGVVVCDSVLPDGDWKNLLDCLRESETGPRLIVAIPTPDDRLWAEVLNLGGYDALVKPFRQEEVVRLVSLAWLTWKDLRHQIPPERKPAQIHHPSVLAALAS